MHVPPNRGDHTATKALNSRSCSKEENEKKLGSKRPNKSLVVCLNERYRLRLFVCLSFAYVLLYVQISAIPEE